MVAGDEVVGEGWHEGPGTPHAEVGAIRSAGERARGATLFVTLEPCSHQGHTGPCAPIIRDSGIREVVAAMRDPNPLVDGRGFGLLEESGLVVREGLLRREAEEMNLGFIKHVRTGRPFVTLKMAASLDGKTAARDGSSRWITGEAAREDAHTLRAGADALIVGAGTVASDDPALTVRLPGYRGRQPTRVIVDGRGRLTAGAAVLDGTAPAIVATTSLADRRTRAEWEARGADVLVFEGDPEGQLLVYRVLDRLGSLGFQSVLIEGGAELGWAAVAERLVDRFVLYLAPKLIGGRQAPGILGGQGIDSIELALPVSIVRVERLDEDLKVVADVHRDS